MRVLVCGGRDFARFPGHDKTIPNYAALRAKYDRDHALLVRTMDQLCIDRGLIEGDTQDNWVPSGIHIICGDATGADTDIKDWAVCAWVDWTEFNADWEQFGRAAGPVRNQQMLREGKPDLVIAFPGGRGTSDMVRRAKEAGVEVIEITEPNPWKATREYSS